MSDYEDEYLSHKGKRGMKWGYNDGKRNGKRTAGDALKDALGYDERARYERAYLGFKKQENEASRLQDYRAEERFTLGTRDPYDGSKSYTKEETQYINKLNAKLKRQRDKVESSRIASNKAFEAYMKTPLGKLDMTVTKINRGKEFVAESLEKLAEKVRSSKRHISAVP